MQERFSICLLFVLFIAGFMMSGCANTDVDKRESPNDGNNAESLETIDDEVTHVYIAFGQSNMQGPGAIEAQDIENVSDRFRVLNVLPDIYNGENRAAGQWYKAVPPLIIPDRNIVNYKKLRTGLSPIDYFGRTLIENIPEHISIGVIAVASGDMGLAAFAKNSETVMAYYNSTASDTAKQGMDKYHKDMYGSIIAMAKIAQETGVIKGIIIHQGESGVDNKSGSGWGNWLKSIYDDMLADLGLEPNSIPVLAGQTFNGGSGNTGGELARINDFIPLAHVISSSGCKGRLEPDGVSIDNVHFGSEGLREMGKRYGRKMLELNY